MKFKIKKGTETFKKLKAIEQKIKDCNNAAIKFLKTIKGCGDDFTIAYDAVGGGISGIEFKEKPEGWRLAHPRQSSRLFFPKATRQNKELLKKIASLPIVTREEVNNIVGFTPNMGGLTFYRCVGIEWGKDFILMNAGGQYTPPSDVVEILESEFIKLSKELEA